MLTVKRASFAIVCLFGLSCVANAAPIYNNLNSTRSGADPVVNGPYGPIADSFTTGSSDLLLTDVWVKVAGSPSAGSIDIALMSDSSTSPGALLTSIGSLSDNSLSGSYTNFDFVLSTPYLMSPNTRYWVELSSSNTTASWAWSLDQAALGVAGEHFFYGNGTHPNTQGPYQLQVNASEVPEPMTLTLLGSGLVGMVARRRKNVV